MLKPVSVVPAWPGHGFFFEDVMTEAQQPEERLPFNEKAFAAILPVFQQLFEQIPELRSAVVVLDWQGELNKAMPPCVWMDEHGPAARPQSGEAIVGSMQQVMRTFEQMTDTGFELIEAYDRTFQQKEELLKNVEGRLDEQKQRLEEFGRRGQEAARSHQSGSPPELGEESGDDSD